MELKISSVRVCLSVVRHFEGRLREVGSKSRYGTDPTSKLTKNHFPNRPQIGPTPLGSPDTRAFVILVPTSRVVHALHAVVHALHAVPEIAISGNSISGNVLILGLAFGAPCRARLVLVDICYSPHTRSSFGATLALRV